MKRMVDLKFCSHEFLTGIVKYSKVIIAKDKSLEVLLTTCRHNGGSSLIHE